MIILISTEQMRVKLQGNGETKNFSFPFLLNKKTDLLVRTWDGETLRTVSDWTVEPVNGIWPTTGGTVVYPLSASPVASNITVIIERDIDIIQSDSYQRSDSLSMTSLERTFDSNVQRIQEVQDRALRAVVLPVQSDYEDIDPRLPIPKPNMGFYWDETGTKLVEGMNEKEATERAEAAAAAAKQSEENAAASAERTEELAEKVFEGIDEAKQAAKDAKASAEDAAESAELAKQRADSIKGDTEKAAASAKAAQDAADVATQQAENASASASRAEVNAQAAQWARDAAAESAENAAVSEANAKQSAQEAYYSARDSLQFSQEAKRSAESAERSEDSARNSAISAKMSEIEAKNSAEEAKQAAAEAHVSLNFKGGVSTKDDLPTNPETGDWWFIEDTGGSVVWNGTEWVDANGFITIATDEEVRSIFDGSVIPPETYTTATDPEIRAVCAGEEVDEGDPTDYDAEIPALLNGQSVDTGTATDADSGVGVLF